MIDEAEAAREVAKTKGKAVDAAREAGGFIAKYISGPLEQGVGIFEDRLKYARWERQVRLMERADAFLRDRGISDPTRAVPLKVAIPLFQEASLEDDDELQDRWAHLLANAADKDSGIDIHRSYIEILSQISPIEARILDEIYAIPFDDAQHRGIATDSLPGSARLIREDREQVGEPSDDVMLALGNLARLGCIRPMGTFGGGESFSHVNPTVLGREFVAACSQINA